MYFRTIPKIRYTLDNKKSIQVVTDIFRRVQIRDAIRSNMTYYDEYDIGDGETPEIIADQLYGDSTLHWIILLVNDIIDPRYEWPLTHVNLNEYCINKYGANNIYATHHYENSVGIQVNSTVVGAVSISNFQFEDAKNELKRRIKILTPAGAAWVIDEFSVLINR